MQNKAPGSPDATKARAGKKSVALGSKGDPMQFGIFTKFCITASATKRMWNGPEAEPASVGGHARAAN